MPRFLTRPALALLGTLALLCLAACAPTATVSESSSATATMRPTATPTPTPTLVPAPTPTNVPAGWTVLVGSHFSLAYPPGWILQTPSSNSGALIYNLEPPNPQNQGVQVEIFLLPPSATSADMAPYCLPPNSSIQQTTLAGLPMAYELAGEGLFMRTWTFVNRQRTEYWLDALDEQGTAAVQAQDASILATFRPDNAIPWSC